MNPVASNIEPSVLETSGDSFDFTFVNGTARIAIYDDMRSAPRIMEITPAETGAYIENLATTTYNQARLAGGSIPYTVVREVSENFIHARFREIIVSIMDGGNTIRFADQGPGITAKDKAQLPGFSSAIEPMKSYIRGVGSGLPIVRDYLEISHGSITIEDNLNSGSVITISLVEKSSDNTAGAPNPIDRMSGVADSVTAAMPSATAPHSSAQLYSPDSSVAAAPQNWDAPNSGAITPGGYPAQGAPISAPYYPQPQVGYPVPTYAPSAPVYPAAAPAYRGSSEQQRALGNVVISQLNEKERQVILLMADQNIPLRNTDISNCLGWSGSTVHNTLAKLSQKGLTTKDAFNSKLHLLTEVGQQVARGLSI